MILAIDIGNTRTKVALFDQEELVWVKSCPGEALEAQLQDWLAPLADEDLDAVGWARVGQSAHIEAYACWQRFLPGIRLIPIQAATAGPIENLYQTPHTLGVDRILSVIGARYHHPDQAVLVIDAGTAITYDYSDAEGRYHGGGIAPGMYMRFKALHTFTAQLPFVQPTDTPPLLGRTTEQSIQSGVINGLRAEVAGIISQYEAQTKGYLQVFLTGGDAYLFENHLKSLTFADANLVLRGIFCHITQILAE
ncbi:MAG: type III pantothenate kinase [Bacteroidota bacterium]